METKIKELINQYETIVSQSHLIIRSTSERDDVIKLKAGIESMKYVIDDLKALLN